MHAFNFEKSDYKTCWRKFFTTAKKFGHFIKEYNTERPHQALNMKCPAEIYVSFARKYEGPSEIDYPFHDKDITVTYCGRLFEYSLRDATEI